MQKSSSTLNRLGSEKRAEPMVKSVGCGICWASGWAPFVAACWGPPPYSQAM
ncbi:hypothetical protein ACLQ3F_04870 [Micromonospora sp. DT15]|uniref:hypothetical protein n=1 Tax=Micromonospora sp. DT15 TaxID=3393445 RepID=UPI003CEB9327